MKLSKNLLNRNTIFLVVVVFYIFLVFVFYNQTRAYTITKAQENIEDILLNVQALRSFNSNFQKEEVYRLQQEGHVYYDYFSPQLLSSTYISKEVNKIYNTLRESQGKLPIIIRFASSNPRNPHNKASSKEEELLELFNKSILSSYQEILTTSSGDAIYYAVPTKVTTAECIKCHSDPSLAPKDLVKLYGDEAGFYEHNGEIRALLSTVYPISYELKEGMLYFYVLSISTLLVFCVIGYISYRFLNIIDAKHTQLEELSIKDELTSLYNRRYFNQIYTQEINRALRSGEYFGFAILDVDYFKNYNDSLGHINGDNVLKDIANILKNIFSRNGDYVFRMGGEEFGVIVVSNNKFNIIEQFEKLQSKIKDAKIPHMASKISDYITISAGIYVSTIDIDSKIDFYKEADKLLYKAKEQRDCIVSNVE